MRRRAPGETIEPFRVRIHKRQAEQIYCGLAAWGKFTSKGFTGEYPDPPSEISDRDADCWEPLIVIADAAGGDWPELAREAAIFLVRRGKDRLQTKGVELLQHVLEAFGGEDRLWTEKLLAHLHGRDESPWIDIRGHPLTDRGLADRLRLYGIKSKQIRIGELSRKGYLAEDFDDAWNRYLATPPPERNKRNIRNIIDNNNNNVSDVSDVSARSGNGSCPACHGTAADMSGKGCPTCHPENYGMKPRPAGGYGKGGMQ